jgi:photosystem II stability/assembly factor-like uncharacterized protein
VEELETRCLLSTLNWQPLHEPGNGGWTVNMAVSPFDHNRILQAGDNTGANVSLDGGNTWQACQGLQSYENGQFTFSPWDTTGKTVWLATLGGPYKSTDGGLNWRLVRNGMDPPDYVFPKDPIEKILFDPNHQNHLLAFGGSARMAWPNGAMGAVWESTDGGNSWLKKTTLGGGSGYGILDATYAGSTLYAVYDSQGIFKSTDNGATWSTVNTGLPQLHVSSIAADPTHPQVLYCSIFSGQRTGTDMPGGIYKTTNGGGNWQAITNGLATYTYTGGPGYDVVAVSPSNPNILYTDDTGNGETGTYKSTNGGASWVSLPPPSNFYVEMGDHTIAIDPRDSNHVFEGGMQCIDRTTDGTHFSDIGTVASGSGWKGTGNAGLWTLGINFNPYNPSQVILSAHDGGYQLQSTDGMKSWNTLIGPSFSNDVWGGTQATFSQSGTIYATVGQFGGGGTPGILKSTDKGVTWHFVTNPSPPGSEPDYIYCQPSNANSVWVDDGHHVYHSTNGGSSWTQVTATDDGYGRLAADPTAPSTLYVAGLTGVWMTTDGTHFSRMTGTNSPSYHVQQVIVDPTNHNRLYATEWNPEQGVPGGLFRYANGTWIAMPLPAGIPDPLTVSTVAVDPTNGQRIVIGTSDWDARDIIEATGVWLSEDGGASWTQQNKGLGMLRVQLLMFNPNRAGELLLGTDGQGFYKAEFGSPLPVKLPTHLLQGETLGTLRHDHPGFVGMKFTTGSSPVAVGQLGRWVVSGNSQSHVLELVKASTGVVVALATVNTAGAPAGAFTYAYLASPVTLAANTTYYLVSNENNGDAWYSSDSTVTPTSLVKSIDGPVAWTPGGWLSSSWSNHAFVPLDFVLPNLVKSVKAGGLRTDGGAQGMQFTTGPSPVRVTQLGRWVIKGNSHSHLIELVMASTGAVVASTTVNTAGATPGTFAYAALATPYTLAANTTYYLVSNESNGGDQWYDSNATVTPSNLVKSIDGPVYWTGTSWSAWASPNHSYDPVDLIDPPASEAGESSAVPGRIGFEVLAPQPRAESHTNALGDSIRFLVAGLPQRGFPFEHLAEVFPGPERNAATAFAQIKREMAVLPLALEMVWQRLGRVDSGSFGIARALGESTAPSFLRVGPIDEWHLVFAKVVQEIAFGLASWFSEEAMVVFGPAFSQARFNSVWSVGNSVNGDGLEPLQINLPEAFRGLFPLHRNSRLEAFERLDRSLETDRSWFDAVFAGGVGQDCGDGQRYHPLFRSE